MPPRIGVTPENSVNPGAYSKLVPRLSYRLKKTPPTQRHGPSPVETSRVSQFRRSSRPSSRV